MQWLWYNAYSSLWSRDSHLFLYSVLICGSLSVVQETWTQTIQFNTINYCSYIIYFFRGWSLTVIDNSQRRHNQSFLLKERKAYYQINGIPWSWLPRLTWKTTHYISSVSPTLRKVSVDKISLQKWKFYRCEDTMKILLLTCLWVLL